MPEFFSSDGSLLLQFAVIFAVLVVVLMAGYLLYRRFAGRGLSAAVRGGTRSRQPRLGIVDIYELDRQRQLILLRRDNVEHLLLVGGPNDVVVERNVQRGSGSRLPAERVVRPEPAPDMALEPHPDGASGQPAFPPPSFEMPVVVPPPLPGSDAQPDAKAPRLDPALFEQDAAEPPSLTEPEPAAEPANARARASRFLRRTPPPLVNPKPETVPERAQPEPAFDAVPPVMAAPEPRAVDPAVLSDMARQLEVALRRPSSAVTPPPGQPRPVPPAAAPTPPPSASPAPAPQAPPKPDPIATAMSAPPKAPEPSSGPPALAGQGLAPEPTPPPVPPAPRPVPPVPAAPAPARPASEPAPAARPVPPPLPAPEPEPSLKDNNPFSVEEIEAEFARLLGRSLDKKN